MASEFFVENEERTYGRVHYKLIRHGSLSKQKRRDVYVASVLKKETYGTVQLAKELEARNPLLSERLVRLMIGEMADLIGKVVSEGRMVNIGGVVRFMPVIHGTFDSPDEPLDPAKHKILIKACSGLRMRKAAAESPATRISAPEVPVLRNVQNSDAEMSGTVSAQKPFFVFGERLVWDSAAEDEGWFINLGGTERKCSVLNAEAPTVTALRCDQAFEAPGTPILLIFRTRLGGRVLHQVAYPNPLVTT